MVPYLRKKRNGNIQFWDFVIRLNHSHISGYNPSPRKPTAVMKLVQRAVPRFPLGIRKDCGGLGLVGWSLDVGTSPKTDINSG